MDLPAKEIVKRSCAMACVIAAILCQGIQAAEPRPSSLQEQAEFLAGIPLGKDSILSALQKSPEYRQHQKELQEQWAFCRKVRYGTMQQWARDHLANVPSTRGVLRYLFGGPDFLNAYAFFPDTRVMVLGGLEPVGEVPPPEALDPASLGGALKALDEALHTSLFCGYFITSEMKPQLVQGSFRGVLPVLYTELALTGNVIDSVTMVRPFGSPGVQIVYHRPGGAPQMLYYFQADLSNGRECRRFLDWLADLGPGASYLKAASYLLPLDSFSETRNFLMRTSNLILQDDSGLPFRSFLPGEWKIQLFGIYTEPLEIFKRGKEPALKEAYDSPLRVGPLPFGAGYHVSANDANLLLALRSGSGSAHLLSGDIISPIPPIPPIQAPAALPAFSSPTPKPKPVPIRKALPVPVKKAIAVPTPRPPRPEPISSPTSQAVPPQESARTEQILMPPQETAMPEPSTIPERVAPESVMPEPALPSEPESTVPLTTSGKPID
ncbi:MAG: hypothetical protein WAL87_02490 [Chthoniobacterales bacterium]